MTGISETLTAHMRRMGYTDEMIGALKPIRIIRPGLRETGVTGLAFELEPSSDGTRVFSVNLDRASAPFRGNYDVSEIEFL